MRGRGFVQRAAAAAALCMLGGLLLIIPSVSSDTAATAATAATTENHPHYSRWQPGLGEDNPAAPSAAVKLGSFQLQRPASELFARGLADQVYDIVSAVPPSRGEVETYWKNRARRQILAPDTRYQEFQGWLLQRKDGVARRLLVTGADYVTDYLSDAAQRQAQGASFLRQVEWDYQTALGERRWQGGLSALGAFRETDQDAIVWQLRGYAAEQSSAGANAGLIYRRAAGNGLLGANVFFDYEQHGKSEADFTRWSIGGEYRNAYIDLAANRYFALNDAVSRDDELYYSQDGSDVQLNVNMASLRLGEVSGGLTYYRWEGNYGDKDDKGLRYHLRLAPSSGRLNLQLEVDSPDGGSVELGGRVSYQYRIGEKDGGGAGLPAEEGFDARAHFFDAVRREYAQRIRRAGDGRGSALRVSVITGSAVIRAVAAGATGASATLVTLAAGDEALSYTRQHTLSVTVSAASTLQMQAGSDWGLIAYQNSDLRILNDSRLLSMAVGTVFVSRRSGEVRLASPNTTLALFGTRVLFRVPGTTERATVDIYEGRVSILADYDSRPVVTLFQPPPGSGNRVPLPPALQNLTVSVNLPRDDEPQMADAVFMLSDPPAGVPARLMVGCGSAQLRANHRLVAADDGFAGCPGDALLGGLAAGATVELVTQGDTLTLSGVDDGSGNVSLSVASMPAVRWARYPFSPHEASLRVADDAVMVLYGLGAAATAAVEVAASSTVQLFYGEASGGLAAAALTVNMYVRGGGVSGIGGDSIMCGASPALTPQTEHQLRVEGACGNRLVIADADAIRIRGRVSATVTRTIPVGNGGGDYRFQLSPGGGALQLQNESGAAATLALSADTVLPEQAYRLVASPPPDLARRFNIAAVTATIRTEVLEGIIADLPTEAPVFRTRLDSNIALLTIGFQGVGGGSEIRYNSDPDFISGDADDFTISGREIGSMSVTIALTRAIETAITVTIAMEAVDDHPGDDSLDSTITVTARLIARDPGAIISQPPVYAGTVIGSGGHYVYSRRVGQQQDLATIRGVANDGLSGLAEGEDYEWRITAPVSGFTVAVEGGVRGSQGIVRFADPANLPAAGDIEVMVEINDSHGAADGGSGTPNLTLTLSITLAAPLALAAASYEGAGLAIDTSGAPVALATITVVGGVPTFRYEIAGATPSDAQALFDVDSGGVVSYNNAAYAQTRGVTVTVQVTDRLGELAVFQLSLSVTAPLVVGTPAAVTVHNTHNGVFYNPTEGTSPLVSGGKDSYDFELINGSDGAFALADAATGEVRLADTPPDAGNYIVSVSVSSGPAVTSYTQQVIVIDNNLSLPAGLTVRVLSDYTGAVTVIAATWTPPYSIGDSLRRYALINSPPAGVTIDERSGRLGLESALAAGQVPITVQAAVGEQAIVGVAPAMSEVVIASHERIMLADGSIVAHFSAGEQRIYTFAPQGGSGLTAHYSYSSADLPGILEIRNGNELWQIGGVDSVREEVINVQVADGTPGAGGPSSDTARFVIRWQAGIHTDGYAVLAGGDYNDYKSDVWAFQGGAGFGGKWIELTGAGGFDGRYGAGIAELGRTLYLGGGTDDGDGGDLDRIHVSPGGAVWTDAATVSFIEERLGHGMLSFNGALYIIGGNKNGYQSDVHRSADGADWVAVSIPSGQGFGNLAYHAALVHNSEIYLLGGYSGAGAPNRMIWVSGDGVGWEARPQALPADIVLPGSETLKAVSHFGRLYIMEADGSKPWVSADSGVSWTEVDGESDPGYGLVRTAFVQNTLIYVLGANGLFASGDGATWTKVNAAGAAASGVPAGFSTTRTGYPVVVYTPPPLRLAVNDAPAQLTPPLASGATLFTAAAGGGIGGLVLGVTTAAANNLPLAVNGERAVVLNGTIDGDYNRQVAITVSVTDAGGAAVTTVVNLLIAQPLLTAAERPFFLFHNAPENHVIATVGTRSGSGISYAISGTRPPELQINPANGELRYLGNADKAKTLEIEITASEGGESETATYTVRLEAPVHPDGYAVIAGGNVGGARSDVWAFQAATGGTGGLPLTELSGDGGYDARYRHALAGLNGTLYLGGGQGSEWDNFYSSVNGVDWERGTRTGEPFNRYYSVMVPFKESLYLIGGSTVSSAYPHPGAVDIWKLSGDGTDWRQVKEQSGAGRIAETNVFVHSDGRLYMIGGLLEADNFNAMIFSSGNGEDWVSHADISASGIDRNRVGRAVSYLGRMYYIQRGGEVWVSEDEGRHWVSPAEVIPGDVQAAFVQNTLIYVMATDGIYSSSDGAAWTQVQPLPAGFGNRNLYHQVAVYTPAGGLRLPVLGIAAVSPPPPELYSPFSVNRVLFTVTLRGGTPPYATPEVSSGNIPGVTIRQPAGADGDVYEVYLGQAVPPVVSNTDVEITVSARDADNSLTTYLATIEFRVAEEIDLENSGYPITRFLSADALPLTSFSGSGGSGDIAFSFPEGTPAAVTDKLELAAGGSLMLKAGQATDADVILTVTVQAINDTGRGLAAYTLRLEAPIHPGGYAVMAGGVLSGGTSERDVWAFQGAGEGVDGLSLTLLAMDGGFGARARHGAAALNGTLYLGGGTPNTELYSSVNGANWTQRSAAAFFNRINHALVSFEDALHLIGSGNTYRSTDGEIWSEVASTGRAVNTVALAAALVHNGDLYLVDDTGVYVSGDGEDWVFKNTLSISTMGQAIEFDDNTRAAQVVSHQGTLYLMEKNGQVWQSGDNGVSWTERVRDAAYGSARAVFVQNTLMFVIASDGVWSSFDGAAWTPVQALPAGYGDTLLYPVAVYTPSPLSLAVAAPSRLAPPSDGDSLFTVSVSGGLGAYSLTLLTGAPSLTVTIGSNHVAVVEGAVDRNYSGEVEITVSVSDGVSATSRVVAIQIAPPLLAAAERPFFLFHSAPAGHVIATVAFRSGSGISYSADSAGGGLEVDAANGELRYLGDISEARTLEIEVTASEGSASETTTYTVRLEAPVHPDGYAVVAGGFADAFKGDVWAFQAAGEGNSGLPMTQLTPDGGYVARFSSGLAGHNGLLYIVGGGGTSAGKNNTYSSANGSSWTRINIGAPANRSSPVLVSYKDSLYLIGGVTFSPSSSYAGDVWKLSNGNAWEPVISDSSSTFGHGIEGAAAFVHSDGNLYLAGGFRGEDLENRGLWYSADGQTWNLRASLTVSIGEDASDDMLVRSGNQVVSYLDKMYFIDSSANGPIEHHPSRRVWVSEDDGLNWKVADNDPDYGVPVVAFVQNTLIYVIADNGLWSSSTGEDWQKVQDIPAGYGGEGSGRGYYFDVAVYTPAQPLELPLAVAVQGELPTELTPPLVANQVLFTVSVSGGSGTYNSPTATSGDIADLRIQIRPAGSYEILSGADTRPANLQVAVTVRVTDDDGGSATLLVTIQMLAEPVLFMAGGVLSGNVVDDIWYSPDGAANWYTLAVSGDRPEARRNAAAVVLNNTVILAGGHSAKNFYGIWASGDGGQSWEQLVPVDPNDKTLTYRRRLGMLAHNGTLYIAGGDDHSIGNNAGRVLKGDVWASTDGRTWTRRAANAFPGRVDFAMAGLNNTLYVIGGRTRSNGAIVYFHDIWQSSDGGASWAPVTVTDSNGVSTTVVISDELLTPRAVELGGTIHVIAGTATDGSMLELPIIWSSTDGKIWDRISKGIYSKLSENGLVVHNGEIYVFPGDGSTFDRVYASSNGGRTWVQRHYVGNAENPFPADRSSYVVWSVRVPLEAPP